METWNVYIVEVLSQFCIVQELNIFGILPVSIKAVVSNS